MPLKRRTILTQAKLSGINLVQTYVFWDIHEPANNEFYFPSDPHSNADLVAFVQLAAELGLYVNLRISGYVCAEWNYGGLPVWLRDYNKAGSNTSMVFRTYDANWMRELSEFFDKTVDVVNEAGLLAVDGGPIVMMQMENEYGNMEDFYGEEGHKYVAWAADYAMQINTRINKDIVWIMCQQGEGVGKEA
jgi:beta-galactosidase GanA